MAAAGGARSRSAGLGGDLALGSAQRDEARERGREQRPGSAAPRAEGHEARGQEAVVARRGDLEGRRGGPRRPRRPRSRTRRRRAASRRLPTRPPPGTPRPSPNPPPAPPRDPQKPALRCARPRRPNTLSRSSKTRSYFFDGSALSGANPGLPAGSTAGRRRSRPRA